MNIAKQAINDWVKSLVLIFGAKKDMHLKIMLDTVNWKGIRTIWRDYKITISIFLLISIINLALFMVYISGPLKNFSIIDIFSINIGLIGLLLALWSIQSTTISFREVQADYWNTRGIAKIDDKDYHNAYQAYDKAIDMDNHSIKYEVNKANALLEQGRRYREKSSLISALNTINKVLEKGPKYPATYKKNTIREEKAEQEYANAFKTECDILLELASISEIENHTSLPIQQHCNNFPYLHFSSRIPDCSSLKDPILKDKVPRSETLRICAIKAIKESINKYPKSNRELPGAYVSEGHALQSLGKYDDAIQAYEKAILFWARSWSRS